MFDFTFSGTSVCFFNVHILKKVYVNLYRSSSRCTNIYVYVTLILIRETCSFFFLIFHLEKHLIGFENLHLKEHLYDFKFYILRRIYLLFFLIITSWVATIIFIFCFVFAYLNFYIWRTSACWSWEISNILRIKFFKQFKKYFLADYMFRADNPFTPFT